MSFDTTQKLESIDTVQYNYHPTTFYKTQYQDTIKNSGYIKIPYPSKSNQPNIAIFGKGYVTTALYIVKPTHLIKNTYYNAELIIEHRSLTNYNEPLYTCFLLKSLNTQPLTTIDKIIESKDDTVLDLNSMMGSQTTIHFENNMLKSAHIIIFTKPIFINTVFEGGLKPGVLLSPYVDEYSILNAEPILGNKGKIIEGMDNAMPDVSSMSPTMPDMKSMSNNAENTEDTTRPSNSLPEGSIPSDPSVSIAGYCQPIDETDPTIAKTAGIVIPINSEISNNKAADTTIKTLLNFVGFFVLILAAAFISPVAHRILIVELILDNEDFTAQRKLNRTNAADVYTSTLLFAFSIAFINYGIINNTSMATIIGFYVFIFTMASIMILQYNRIFSPATYLSQFKTSGVLPSFENVEMDWGFFMDNISNLFFTKTMIPNEDPFTKDKSPMVPSYNFNLSFIVFMVFYSGMIYLLKRWGVTKTGGKFFLTSIYFYLFLFAIYLVSLFNHFRYINEKLGVKPPVGNKPV